MAAARTYLAYLLTVCICLETLGREGVAGVPLAANKRIRRFTCPTYCPCGVNIDFTSCSCKACDGDSPFSIGPKDVRFKRSSSCPRYCPCGDFYDGQGRCKCNPCPGQQELRSSHFENNIRETDKYIARDSPFSIGPKDVRFKRSSSCPRYCPCGDFYDGQGRCKCNPCPGQQEFISQ